jgi:hypothetical protein
MLKRALLLIIATAFSMLVAADCAQTCQEQYDECMAVAHTMSKQGLCGETLHECKMGCSQ